MEKQQIVKALEVCSNYQGFGDCDKCPAREGCDTENGFLEKEALSLVREQEKRINVLWSYQVTLRDMHKKLLKAQHDVERYARKIREQREEILNLLAMLDAAAAGQETLQKALVASEKCVSCGDVIPEGRQVCPTCEMRKESKNDTSK